MEETIVSKENLVYPSQNFERKPPQEKVRKASRISRISRLQINNRISNMQMKRNTNMVIQSILESVDQEQMFGSVYDFTMKIMEDQSLRSQILKVFKKVKSGSISGGSSSNTQQSQSQSTSSVKNSQEQTNELHEISNKYPRSQKHSISIESSCSKIQPVSVRKSNFMMQVPVEASLMRKSARISIADVVTIKDLKVTFDANAIEGQKSDQSLQNKSFKQNQIKQCDETSFSEIEEAAQRAVVRNNKKKSTKKISIMLDDVDIQSGQIKSQFSSNNQYSPTLEDIHIPELQFDVDMVRYIYESPAPFLINLSLCLLFKLMQVSKIQLTKDNAVWMMAISTFVSYKIYYDEPISDLVQCFAQILGVESSVITTLEVWFLNKINYEVNIENTEYYSILSKWALS